MMNKYLFRMGTFFPFFIITILCILLSSTEALADKRDANVIIQILSSANGKGEVGECE